MAEQVQKAVDCWNAGATVLHVHVREADGRGSKRLSMFNELLERLREAVPVMEFVNRCPEHAVLTVESLMRPCCR